MEKMMSINSRRLLYAREFYDFSLDEVSVKTKLNIQVLRNYENGSDHPSYPQLEKLADLYNQPIFFFFLNDNPPENKIAVAFRSIEKRQGIELNKRTKELMEKASIYKMNLEELYHDELNVSFSKMLIQDSVNSDNYANWLRDRIVLSLEGQKDKFRSSSILLEYVRERLFALGVYIFKDSFHDNSISGLCLYDNMFPIILLNNKTTFSRQLFTVFHEMFHLFHGEPDVDFSDMQAERDCNRFASEFLIPEKDFMLEISGARDFENRAFILSLATKYCVSEDAIMYRLLDKNLISSAFYNIVRDGNIRLMNSESSGGNFYYTRISYLGKKYISKVFNAYYSGKISVAQVGSYTYLKPVHVSKLASSMYGGAF